MSAASLHVAVDSVRHFCILAKHLLKALKYYSGGRMAIGVPKGGALTDIQIQAALSALGWLLVGLVDLLGRCRMATTRCVLRLLLLIPLCLLLTCCDEILDGSGDRSSERPSTEHLPEPPWPTPESTPRPTPTRILDTDTDGISNEREWYLIEKVKPVLIFDENEPLDVVNETLTLYQVSPVRRGGQEGYLITVVMLYPYDTGMINWDLDGWDHVTCGSIVGEVVARAAEYDRHCGDSEPLRIFVADYGPTDWKIEAIDIKRHGNDWEPYDDTRFSYERDEETGLNTHPIVYVSEGKHAMYPSENECDNYSHVFYDFGVSCNIKFEDCGGGIKLNLYTPEKYNVGERERQNFDSLGEVTNEFPGAYAWADKPFCGGWAPESCSDFAGVMLDKACPGVIGHKWFPTIP
jgi:hypothetical protein